MRKLKILVVTLMATLLMASPAYAVAIVANIGGTVNINSNNETTKDSNNDNSSSVEDSLVF